MIEAVKRPVRGFDYVLEPVRTVRGWRLDAALAQLAQARHKLEEASTELAKMTRELDEALQASERSWSQRPDVLARTNALNYAALLRRRQLEQQSLVSTLEASLACARRECVLRQADVEALENHRAEQLQKHWMDVSRRQSAVADQEWIQRAQLASRMEK